jgi:hypothetical protein
MGIELRMREPSAEGVVPSRLEVAPILELASPDPACLAGVSRTSFLNCELFIVTYQWRKSGEVESWNFMRSSLVSCKFSADFVSSEMRSRSVQP